ncbi:hypothetical protein PENTCL1PPCAC_29413 [Pristionchus entomophagus]|uniref:Mitochondrial import receptor subunit TOM70 n=1 Tax=Pristionchus entomophagus TaxID=358040 RepID=A0AAV5UMV6_9BILA|nr:hypothetical protein PENTCL1PPCAC_29413 [Pristionchus entomophagus]
MSTEPSGGGDRFPSRTVIAAATGAVVAAGAAYYLYSKSGSASKSKTITFEQLKKWKEEGNTHFIQKRFAEAIERFTDVITECNKTKMHDKNVNKDQESAAEYSELLAACYQNRGAAKQASEDSPLEVISDCSYAISLKPKYARAYIRRSQLLKTMEPKQALADALAAVHIDSKFGQQMMSMMSELMGALEKKNLEDFQRRKALSPVTKPQPITQDQIFTFLHKTLTDDYIRSLVLKKVESSSESLNEAAECIKRRNFEEALAAAEKSEAPECLLLTARLFYCQGNLEKFEECLGKFEKWAASSPDHDHLDDLKISYATMRLETADSIVSLLELFEAAVDSHGPRSDFFSTAAFRCTFLDCWEQALTILTDRRLEHSTVSQVLYFFVQINAIILRNENLMDSYKIIAKFEEFVDALVDKDEHKNWAAFALSKIYITFNNTHNAELLLKELQRRDDSWAVYPLALGHIYTQKEEYKQAIEMADLTLEMEKVNPEAHLLKQSLKLHGQGNTLDPASLYVSLRAEAEPLLTRCLSNAEFPFVNEVLRHIAFIEAKITAANSLCL